MIKISSMKIVGKIGENFLVVKISVNTVHGYFEVECYSTVTNEYSLFLFLFSLLFLSLAGSGSSAILLMFLFTNNDYKN